MKGRPWTDDETALLYETRKLAGDKAQPGWSDVARKIGRSVGSVLAKAHVLGLARTKRRNDWTKSDDVRLVQYVDQNMSWMEIGKALGRSKRGVIERARRLHLGGSVHGRGVLTALQVSKILGVNQKVVSRWVYRGYLNASISRRGRKNVIIFIQWEDIDAFLTNEEHWHRVNPEKIGDHSLREFARDVRNGRYFMTCAEVAEKFGFAHSSIRGAVNRGELPAVRDDTGGSRPGRWLIRDDWATEVLATSKPRRSPEFRHEFTPSDDQVITSLWGEMPCQAIAEKIGCSGSSVWARAKKMGLEQIGVGYWRKRSA